MTAETEEDPAASVRHAAWSVTRAGLGTRLRATGEASYVSLVNVTTDHDDAPPLLLSDLADHTRNLATDERASPLFDGTGEREDPESARAEPVRLARLAHSRLPPAGESPERLV